MVTNMRIRGRVISKWHTHKLNQAHDPYSLELVLQDEEGDRIQVYIKKDWMFRFEPLLQDGICYVISNFGVTENGGKLPLLPHAWKVSFYKNTNVTRVDQIDDNLIGFRNEPFTRILDTNEEYEDLLDSWAKKWNEYAENLDIVGHIDVMLMLGKVKYWNNAPSVHNALFGTQMYINKSIPELLSFRHRYEGREEYDANEHKIQLVAHETKVETECVIYATVHSIQYESGWTYIGCKICSKKVVPLASKGPSSSKTKQTWWCEKHESQDQVASR
ncbi:replication protein A 70 kDa DNA-binding subunit B, partial [Tanacetum coccineum]